MNIIEELKKGENNRLEFKREFPKSAESFLKTVVAFSNGNGGKIVFGVQEEPFQIVGVPENEIFELRDKIANLIVDRCRPAIIPEIYVENVEGKYLLVVGIYPGSEKPYYLKLKGKEEVFVRIGATTRLADEETIDLLKLERFNMSFDEKIIPSCVIEILGSKTPHFNARIQSRFVN